MAKTFLESQIDIEKIITLCDDLESRFLSGADFCSKMLILVREAQPINHNIDGFVNFGIENINAYCIGYEDKDNEFYHSNTALESVMYYFNRDLKIQIASIPGYRNGYIILPCENDFCLEKLEIDLTDYAKSLGGFICDLRRAAIYKDDQTLLEDTESLIKRITVRNEDLPKSANIIVEYKGLSDKYSLINGKAYLVISIENDWYRIIDETYEDYLYPPESFIILAKVNGDIKFKFSKSEKEFVDKYFLPFNIEQPFVVYVILFYRLMMEHLEEDQSSIAIANYWSLCSRFAEKGILWNNDKHSIDPQDDFLEKERMENRKLFSWFLILINNEANKLGYEFMLDAEIDYNSVDYDFLLEGMRGWLVPMKVWQNNLEFIRDHFPWSYDELPFLDQTMVVNVWCDYHNQKASFEFDYIFNLSDDE